MPSLSQVLKSVQHPKRREILAALKQNNDFLSYSDMLHITDDSTGKLNYHLSSLSDLINKTTDGYKLSKYGEKIVKWLQELTNDKTLIATGKPSVVFSDITPSPITWKKYYFMISLTFMIIGVLGIPTIFYFLGIIPAVTFVVLLFAITFLLLLFQNLYLSSIRYNITDTEIKKTRGIITKSAKIIPYRTITNTEVKEGVFDRLFGIYTVEIQTAGNSATSTGPEAKLIGLVDGDEIRETIVERIRLLNPLNSPNEKLVKANSEYLVPILDEFKLLNKELNQQYK